jgi:O-antigen ligase
MLICGSRPIGSWFINDISTDWGYEDGSPLDRYLLTTLIILSIFVLFKRKFKWSLIIKSNKSLIVMYLFLGISILWSDQQFVSLKRWFRLISGFVPVAMVVISDPSPRKALETIFRRCAYILIPISVILAKYYPNYGVSYSRWSGLLSWTGVTLGKNALAHLCLVSSIFLIWNFIRNVRNRNILGKESSRIGDVLVFPIAVYLLFGGPGGMSATSSATFILSLLCIFILYKRKKNIRFVALTFAILSILIWPFLFLSEGFRESAHEVVGRSGDLTFTGRFEVWNLAIKVAERNPILGTGFGSFWFFENEISQAFPGIGQTGHNGLIDAYIEVGITGIILLIGFLVSFYRKLMRELMISFDWTVMGIVFLVICIITNFTESLFLKSSSFIWNGVILLSIIMGSKFPKEKKY